MRKDKEKNKVLGKCQFEVWDKREKTIVLCGKDAVNGPIYKCSLPDFAKNKLDDFIGEIIYLCPEHKEFVIDSLRTEYDIEHKKAIIKRNRLNKKK